MSTRANALGETASLAAFAAGTGQGDLSGLAGEVTCRLVAEVLANAASRWADPVSAMAFASMAPLIVGSESTVIGRATCALARAAAFCNATAAGSGDPLAPDVALATPVVAAAFAATELAAARTRAVGAGELILAALTGLEVATRLRAALGEGHVRHGWFVPGTAGRLGATAAAGRALGLGAGAMADAFGFAATQAAGLAASARGNLGALVQGRAASDGVEAAALAEAGLIGPPQALEGRRGLFALLAPEAATADLLEAPDGRWRVEALAWSGQADDALVASISSASRIEAIASIVEARATAHAPSTGG